MLVERAFSPNHPLDLAQFLAHIFAQEKLPETGQHILLSVNVYLFAAYFSIFFLCCWKNMDSVHPSALFVGPSHLLHLLVPAPTIGEGTIADNRAWRINHRVCTLSTEILRARPLSCFACLYLGFSRPSCR